MARAIQNLPQFYDEAKFRKDEAKAIRTLTEKRDGEAVDYRESNKSPPNPFKISTIEEISLVQTTQRELGQLSRRLDRLVELSEIAKHTVQMSERDYLQQEYDYISEELKQTAKETKYNNVHLFKVQYEDPIITLNKDLFSVFGANPIVGQINLMAKEILGIKKDLDENDSDEPEITKPMSSQQSAQKNIGFINQTYGQLEAMSQSLALLGSRLYDHFRSQVIGGKTGLLRSTAYAQRSSEAVAEQIFAAAESALETHLGHIPDNILQDLV